MKQILGLRYFIVLLFIVAFCFPVKAQNITGTWEGDMGGQFLQLNIQQNGTTLCGFTYDFVEDQKMNHCRAYYTGKYDDGFMVITGTSFIGDNEWDHSLMTIQLLTTYQDGKLILYGKVALGTIKDLFDEPQTSNVLLRRTSPFPQNAPGTSQPCFSTPPLSDTKPTPQIKPAPVKPVPTPVKPKPTPVTPKPAPVTPKPVPTPVKPKPVAPDKVVPKPQNPDPKPVTPQELPARIKERKQDEQGRITVHSKTINLKIYDNGVVDGDTVSVYYDGKLLVDKQRLSEKPIEINITLDDNSNMHQLIMFAENLGGIPPNTALIVVTAGSKRYELHSDADMKKNAVLFFKYEPE